MCDEEPSDVIPAVMGGDFHQALFDGQRIFCLHKTQSVRKTRNVGIHCDCLLPERLAEDNVGGLSSNAGELNQFLAGLRNAPAESFDEHAAACLNVAGFRVEVASWPDVARKLFEGSICERFGSRVLGEELWSDAIDPFICALCRENRCYQKLEGTCKVQPFELPRVGSIQAVENCDDPRAIRCGGGVLSACHLSYSGFKFFTLCSEKLRSTARRDPHAVNSLSGSEQVGSILR